MTDTERRRFREWFAENGGQTEPDFSGHWQRGGEWIFHNAEVQDAWEIWEAALTFRTFGAL